VATKHERSTDLLSLETERRVEAAGFCLKPVPKVGNLPTTAVRPLTQARVTVSLGDVLRRAMRK